jgi:ATP-dependent Lhr-like helicase
VQGIIVPHVNTAAQATAVAQAARYQPEGKLSGKQGVRQAIARLEGFEAAAGAWERELLAARVNDYRSSWLDELCLAGDVTWARLTPRKAAGPAGPSTAAATRITPVSVVLRPDLPTLLSAVRAQGGPEVPKTGAAAEVYDLLQQRGALFFDEIVNGTRRLKTDVERALRQLIGSGLVASDGFQGLRQLVGKGAHTGRRGREGSGYTAGGLFAGSGPAGRWAPVATPEVDVERSDELAEATARVLLQRYGAVFRDLYPRESFNIPWRDVLRALRRLEARGIVRGGRFVSGANGEQFAMPEAVDGLRYVRRQERKGERVWVSALDPANLAGVLPLGEKPVTTRGEALLYVDGLPQPPEAPELPSKAKEPVPSRLKPRLPARPRMPEQMPSPFTLSLPHE